MPRDGSFSLRSQSPFMGLAGQFIGSLLVALAGGTAVILAGDSLGKSVMLIVGIMAALAITLFKFEVKAFLYLLIFITPLGVFTVMPGTGTTVRPFLGFFLFAYWLARFLLKEKKFIVTNEFKWLLVFLAVVVITSYLGISRSRAMAVSFTYAQLVVLIFLILQICRDQNSMVFLLGSVLTALSLVGLIMIGTYLGLWDVSSFGVIHGAGYERVSSIYDSVGHTGYVMFVALLISLCFFKAFASPFARYGSLAGMIISGLGLLLTMTLSAVLACTATLPLVLIRQYRLRFRTIVLYALGLIVMVSALHYLVPAVERRLTRHYNSFVAEDNVRNFTWKAGLEIFLDNPVKGVGAGNTEMLVGDYFPQWHPKHGVSRATHSTFLAFAGDHGIAVIIPLGVLLYMVLRGLYRNSVKAKELGFDLLAQLCGVTMAIIVGSLIVSFFLNLEREDIFWIILGAGMTLNVICPNQFEQSGFPQRTETNL